MSKFPVTLFKAAPVIELEVVGGVINTLILPVDRSPTKIQEFSSVSGEHTVFITS